MYVQRKGWLKFAKRQDKLLGEKVILEIDEIWEMDGKHQEKSISRLKESSYC